MLYGTIFSPCIFIDILCSAQNWPLCCFGIVNVCLFFSTLVCSFVLLCFVYLCSFLFSFIFLRPQIDVQCREDNFKTFYCNIFTRWNVYKERNCTLLMAISNDDKTINEKCLYSYNIHTLPSQSTLYLRSCALPSTLLGSFKYWWQCWRGKEGTQTGWSRRERMVKMVEGKYKNERKILAYGNKTWW